MTIDEQMSDKEATGDAIVCGECDEPIDDEIVWYNPIAGGTGDGEHGSAIFGVATSGQRDGNQLPFHPACFEFRTGQKWHSHGLSRL